MLSVCVCICAIHTAGEQDTGRCDKVNTYKYRPEGEDRRKPTDGRYVYIVCKIHARECLLLRAHVYIEHGTKVKVQVKVLTS